MTPETSLPAPPAAGAPPFADRLVAMANDAALSLMISIGHRTGLFDALAAAPAATSTALAERAGLDERYVREWLGAMVAGGLVDLDPLTGAASLPAEHAACLARDGDQFLASMFQWFAVLGSVEDGIVERFREGGGLGYDAYPRFHEVMAEESDLTVVRPLFDAILPIVPGLTDRLEAGIDVLDVGCGRGRALLALAERYPRSRFVGYDRSDEATAAANEDARRSGLTNVRFEARDAAAFDDDGAFDLVCTFDAVHDQARPDALLSNIRRALRADGVYLMQDIRASVDPAANRAHPMGAFVYTISCLHCMTVSLADGGAGLGAAWGEERALEMLAEAGFEDVRVRTLEHDLLNNYYVARPGAAARA